MKTRKMKTGEKAIIETLQVQNGPISMQKLFKMGHRARDIHTLLRVQRIRQFPAFTTGDMWIVINDNPEENPDGADTHSEIEVGPDEEEEYGMVLGPPGFLFIPDPQPQYGKPQNPARKLKPRRHLIRRLLTEQVTDLRRDRIRGWVWLAVIVAFVVILKVVG